MMTLGQLIDQQAMLMIRRACAHDKETQEVFDKMIGKNRNDIDYFHYQIMTGQITREDVLPNNIPLSIDAVSGMGSLTAKLVRLNLELYEFDDKLITENQSMPSKLDPSRRNEILSEIEYTIWEIDKLLNQQAKAYKDAQTNG